MNISPSKMVVVSNLVQLLLGLDVHLSPFDPPSMCFWFQTLLGKISKFKHVSFELKPQSRHPDLWLAMGATRSFDVLMSCVCLMTSSPPSSSSPPP